MEQTMFPAPRPKLAVNDNDPGTDNELGSGRTKYLKS